MNENRYGEALYKVDDCFLVHLKESQEGCRFAVFGTETRSKIGGGIIPWTEIEDSAMRSTLAAFRLRVFDEAGIEGTKVAAVSLNMLKDFRDSEVRRRSLREPESLPQRDIRFIDSRYHELFRIPDGGCIQIHYPDETVVKPCKFIDEYHTQIGFGVYHICQFAEVMERVGAHYMPEPEIMGDVAAWRVGQDRILAVQENDSGYNYTLLDGKYREIDGGQLDNSDMSMIEARQDILTACGLAQRELRAMFYEDVMENAAAVNATEIAHPEKGVALKRESVLDKLRQAAESPAPAPTSTKRAEPER